MAPYVTCYIVLQVFLLGSAHDLFTINPNNPTVPLGGTIKLNCSTNNPSCKTDWKGSDIHLGSVQTTTGYSILTIENASIAIEGTKICVKTCADRKKNGVNQVALHVYALPKTLLLSTSITNGIPSLNCLMKGIYPIESLIVQCYRGSEQLNEHSEDFTKDEDIGIYNVTRSFEISNEDLQSQASYKCEVELSVDTQTFKVEGTLDIPKEAMTTRRPDKDSTTLYMRTSKKSTFSPPFTTTVFSSIRTLLPISDKEMTPDTLATTNGSKNQSTTMSTPYSTTRTSKERSPTPPSMMFSSLTTHRKPSTPDTAGTTDSLTVTVTIAERQTTDLSTTRTYKERSPSPPSLMFSSLTTHRKPSIPDTAGTTDSLTVTMTIAERQTTDLSTTRTSKERSPSPPSLFSILSTHRKPSTPDTAATTDSLTVTVTIAEHQSTDLSTRTPTTQMTLSSQAASTAFSSFTTHNVPLGSKTDAISVMWMALPAIGLAGSILIFLQVWRQLNKKGFFEPNQSHWSDCKHGSKDLIHRLEAGSSHHVSVK